MEKISRQQMRKILEGTEPFDLKVVTCDRKRKTGGKILELKNCTKTGNKGKNKAKKKTVSKNLISNPNHGQHFTRNIFVNGQNLRKVNSLLIIEINGKEVIP